MSTSAKQDSLTGQLETSLPNLRRYARALTGSQTSGDAFALATLEAIVGDPAEMEAARDVRVALFRAFNRIWNSAGAPVDGQKEMVEGLEATAQLRLQGLTKNTREALLLRTFEEFRYDQIAEIMELEVSEAEELVRIAFAEMAETVSGDVMIIEDEAIIAMDLQAIVAGMGHTVTGIARTQAGAEDLASKKPCDLILADIQLADKSSGIDAVNEILKAHGDRPVVFITAYPERLLTGTKPEPAFLITKPYSEEQVRSAVSQAMFFASTESLMAS
ncbi:MAG: response regulator [Pseudomonadota bacterium]